jgi:hypothetical protein
VQRWQPDEQLVGAIRSGRCSHTYADLSREDRCWAVAGLLVDGCTAERIAELLRCSLRTVHVVKANPMTAVCLAYMTESVAFERESRMLRDELTQALSRAEREALAASRLRSTLARVTAAKVVDGAPPCSKGRHAMTPYNTYTDRRGRNWCRECHRERQAEHRAKRRTSNVVGKVDIEQVSA